MNKRVEEFLIMVLNELGLVDVDYEVLNGCVEMAYDMGKINEEYYEIATELEEYAFMY